MKRSTGLDKLGIAHYRSLRAIFGEQPIVGEHEEVPPDEIDETFQARAEEFLREQGLKSD